MKWFTKSPKALPDRRSDAEILRAYESNENISREECRVLYTLVDDPWDLGSALHYESYARLIALADKYVDWQQIDWIVDYGSGVGTFTKALKDAHPHIKSLGVDFDTAREAADRRFGAQLFDHYYEMNSKTTEYDLLEHPFPNLGIERPCICFINSTYYVFKEQRRRKRIDHFARLVQKFEKLARAPEARYMLVGAGHTDRAAVDAIDRLGPELVHLSRDLELTSRIEQFNTELHTRIWKRETSKK
jgi:hypothetical protein